jgi:hypothetical protein
VLFTVLNKEIEPLPLDDKYNHRKKLQQVKTLNSPTVMLTIAIIDKSGCFLLNYVGCLFLFPIAEHR